MQRFRSGAAEPHGCRRIGSEGVGGHLSACPSVSARRIVCAMQRFRSVVAETQGCRRIEHDGDGDNWCACPGVYELPKRQRGAELQ